MKDTQVKSIRSLARGLEVLQLIQASGALRLHELHRMSGIPKASLLRILKTLMEQGMVWQRIVDDAYMVSFSVTEAASRPGREALLVEVASPILERLSDDLKWPSILAVPRLSHMEVIETNAPRAYFHHIPLGPVGFQINMLRSATGRAYLAFCEDAMREAVLDTLRRSTRPGDRLAQVDARVQAILAETRERGFGLRDAEFGGHFDDDRTQSDDGRDSIGVAIQVGRHVPGAINVTWSKRVMTRRQAIDTLSSRVLDAAAEIARRLMSRHETFAG